jgi:hypothetical protein
MASVNAVGTQVATSGRISRLMPAAEVVRKAITYGAIH